MKPSVKLKTSSVFPKDANLTSKVGGSSTSAADRQQRETRVQRGDRSRSLDRMSSSSAPVVNPGAGPSGYSIKTRSQTNFSPFVSQNQYQVLSDDDTGEVQQEPQKKTPRVRIPPIHIMGRQVGDIVHLLEDKGVSMNDDYVLRNGKSSVQFLTKSKELFTKTVELLKASDVQYFTHDTSESVPIKFVLSGLPLIVIEDLKDELAMSNILPTDIKVLSSSKSKDYALYLLYFARGSVKIQELRKTKALLNIVVSWRYFSKRSNDAAQCHRCQRFGHGSSKCNLTPKCVKCGKEHLTDVCSLPRKQELNNGNNSKSQLKCANCGGSHTANFRGCPSRKTYLDELEKRKQKPKRQAPTINGPSFPGLNGAAPHLNGRPPPAQTGRRSYAHVSARTEPATPHIDLSGDGLFTASEFLNLARDMFNRLVGCRTKQEQFNALADLMSKYLYNG